MAGAGGDEWIYSTTPEESETEKASTQAQQPLASVKIAAPSSSDGEDRREGEKEEYPDWYTPEEVEIEKAYDAYMAALDRALAHEVDDELELELGRAYEAYAAALDRRAAAKIDGKFEIDKIFGDNALRAYRAACERAAKIFGDGAGAGGSSNTGGGAVMENPYYGPYNADDTYGGGGAEPSPYYGSDPASLGLGLGYEYYDKYYGYGYGYEYYDGYYGYGFPGYGYGYCFGFPGAEYGPATGPGYGFGFPGGYDEPYANVPTAVYLAPPPPALNATTVTLYPPRPMPDLYMTPAAYVPPSVQQLRY